MPTGGLKRKAVAAPPAGETGSPAGSSEARLFSCCCLVFWAQHYMQRMQQRVQQLGGSLQVALAGGSTHVVCPPAMTMQQAAAKGFQGARDGVAFVTPDWVSQSIVKRQLQPVEQFQPAFLSAAADAAPAPAAAVDGRDAAFGTGGQQKLKGDQQQAQQQEEHEEKQQRAATKADRPTSSTATVPFNEQELWAAQQDVSQPPVPAPDTGGTAAGSSHQQQQLQHQEEQQQRVPCRVERHGSEFVAVQGVKPPYTGGGTGIPWGSYGVWDEPVDPAAARQTVDHLRHYWFHTHDNGQQTPSASPQPPPAVELNGVCPHVCCSCRPFCLMHQLAEVKKVYMEGRGVDQFKLKAIDRAMQQLILWNEALDSDADVDWVGLGAKSAGKVKEILHSGALGRVQAAAQDEQLQVLNVFLEVWGAGAGTINRWYSAGCRTLQDVQRRDDLTEQQKVGLKYYDDIKRKIPRAEVAQAEAIVREACFDLAERLGASDVERTYCFATGSYRRGKPESSDIDSLICLPPSLSHASSGAFLTQLLVSLLDCGLLVDEMNPSQPHVSSQTNNGSWMGLCRPPGSSHFRRIDVKVYANEHTPFAVNYFSNSQSFCRATRYYANHAVAEVARRFNPRATGFKLSDKDLQPIIKQGRPGGGGGGRGRGRSSGSGGRRKGPRSSDSEDDAAGGGGGRGSSSGRAAADGGITVLGPKVPCADETAIFRLLGLAYVPVHMRYFHDFF